MTQVVYSQKHKQNKLHSSDRSIQSGSTDPISSFDSASSLSSRQCFVAVAANERLCGSNKQLSVERTTSNIVTVETQVERRLGDSAFAKNLPPLRDSNLSLNQHKQFGRIEIVQVTSQRRGVPNSHAGVTSFSVNHQISNFSRHCSARNSPNSCTDIGDQRTRTFEEVGKARITRPAESVNPPLSASFSLIPTNLSDVKDCPDTNCDIDFKSVDREHIANPKSPQEEIESRRESQREKEFHTVEIRRRQSAQCNFPESSRTQGCIKKMGSSERSSSPFDQHQLSQRRAANENRSLALDSSALKNQHSHGVRLGNGGDLDSTIAPPTPFFERFSNLEGQELKSCAREIESKNRRVSELEKSHDDIEKRLEMACKKNMDLEAQLEDEQQKWANSRESLEKEAETWRSRAQLERTNNERLLDQLNRKDKEIHRMIQRKYDAAKNTHQHQHSHNHTQSHTMRRSDGSRQQQSGNASSKHSHPPTNGEHKGPHELLKQNGTSEVVRGRNVIHSLVDFFGL